MGKQNYISSFRVLALKNSQRVEQFFRQNNVNSFSIFEAYNGQEQGIPDLVDIDQFEKMAGRAVYPGEVGCVYSHYLILKDFVNQTNDTNGIILIAEDDARFSVDAKKIICSIIKKIKWDNKMIVILGSPGEIAGKRNINWVSQNLAVMSIFSRPLGLCGFYPYLIGRIDGCALGTGAYLISYEAAKAYIELVEKEKIAWFADSYHIWASRTGTTIKIIRPSLVSWEGDSTIGGKGHEWNVSELESNKNKFDSIIHNIALRTRLKRIRRSINIGITQIWSKQ